MHRHPAGRHRRARTERAWVVENIVETLTTINRRLSTHMERLGFDLPAEAQKCPYMLSAVMPEG